MDAAQMATIRESDDSRATLNSAPMIMIEAYQSLKLFKKSKFSYGHGIFQCGLSEVVFPLGFLVSRSICNSNMFTKVYHSFQSSCQVIASSKSNEYRTCTVQSRRTRNAKFETVMVEDI